jgi:hypothetical protein
MAHWAELDTAGVVLRVTVGSNDDPDEGLSWLVENLGGTWVKTSYNTHGGEHPGGTPFRYNYAGIGFTFDPDFGPDGAFIPPQPFPSWVLNPDTALWDAPVPMPETEGMWSWDEDAGEWVNLTP